MEMVVILFLNKNCMNIRALGTRGVGGNPPSQGFGCFRNKTFWLKTPSPTPKDFPTFWMSQVLIITSILCSPILILST